jgi:hypothetical protein
MSDKMSVDKEASGSFRTSRSVDAGQRSLLMLPSTI